MLANKLKEAETPIITRDHHTNEGYFQIETRFLDFDDINYICEEIKKIIKNHR